ncbi:MAG: pirin family protein [Intrasporangium sp.]|uniref:pirin family protein n=1 Tax=Intrasporangium sp. TaxID=1925024 RepID=UPI0026486704|nr:pirin family protein [Intrasporangium sp.]MDN5797410.1 pirin family protein [Intrasporangium sp.]
MSNLEKNPAEVVCADRDEPGAPALVLACRDVPLGGPRAMTVRRSLPQRERSLIGAWCFVDHYGPDDVAETGGMVVPGHPHTGLQTVSWLFTGEIEHRDTTGAHALVRPGQMNLMTAGSGIAHSEYSTPATTMLHGVQLWTALPEQHRFVEPRFEHYEPPVVEVDGARALVFLGTLFGQASPVSTYSELVGAEITLPPGGSLDIDVDPAHEHGFLCDTGTIASGEAVAKPGEIIFHPDGPSRLVLQASPTEPTRVLLIGGRPLGEQIVMWWNLVGRSHDEVVGFREDWQRERAVFEQERQLAGEPAGAPAPAREGGDGGIPDGVSPPTPRYGAFPAVWETTLPAPGLPNIRLRSRG